MSVEALVEMPVTGPAARAGGRPAGWAALAVLMLLYLLSVLDRQVLSLVVDEVKRDLAIGDVEMSLLMGGAFAITHALFALPFGILVDRFPRRAILYGGVAIWSAATMACGFAQSYQQLLLARLALGIGEAALAPSAHSMLADMFAGRRLATALSLFTAGSVVGLGASTLIGGLAVTWFSQADLSAVPLLAGRLPWQAVFILLGLPGALIGLLVFSFREPPRQRQQAAAGVRGFARFLRARWRVLACFTGSFILFGIIVHGVAVWSPAHMARHFGWTASRIGGTLGPLDMAAMAAGVIGSGMLVDWLARRGHDDAPLRVFVGALCVGAPVGIVAFLARDPWLFLALNFIFKLTAFSYWGYAAAAVQAVTPSAFRGKASALYLLTLTLFGGGLGPSMIALVSARIFHDPSMLGASIALLIAILAPLALAAALAGMKAMRAAVVELAAGDRAPSHH